MTCGAALISRCIFLMNWLGYVLYISVVFLIISLLPDVVNRGIYCGDTSVIYPIKKEIISDAELILISGIPVAVLFTIVICVVLYAQMKKENEESGDPRSYVLKIFLKYSALTVVPTWLLFSAGALSCYLFVEVVKITVGKYRPHFLSVCKPYGNDVNPSWATIPCNPNSLLLLENFNCAASDDEIHEALKSFPSGHATLSFYWVIFGILHLEFYMSRSRKLHFFKGLLQICLLVTACYVAFSRVADNNHELVDVLVGIIIGTVFALSTFKSYPNTCHRNMFGIHENEDLPISPVLSQHIRNEPSNNPVGCSNNGFNQSEKTWQM